MWKRKGNYDEKTGKDNNKTTDASVQPRAPSPNPYEGQREGKRKEKRATANEKEQATKRGSGRKGRKRKKILWRRNTKRLCERRGCI
jgi:hypothetical protein